MRAMLIAALLVAGCSGCGAEDNDGTESANPPPTTAPPEKRAPEQPAGPLVEDPRFELRATAEAQYPAGQLGRFGITLTGRDGWHVNQDYPTAITLRAPSAVTFPKDRLEKTDAAEFTEPRARFDVPFTPGAAGEHRCTAEVDFAICTDETCIPVQRTLAVVLPVQ